MCGGFTHCPGHLGSRQAVLRRGDAVRQRLTRHLLSEEINLDFQASNMVLPPHTYTLADTASVFPAALRSTSEQDTNKRTPEFSDCYGWT